MPALEMMFILHRAHDGGANMSTLALLLWRYLSLLGSCPPSLLSSSWSAGWKLVAPPLTDTFKIVILVQAGALQEPGQAWGTEMSTRVVATPPALPGFSSCTPPLPSD